jgi:hypothetical protein
LHKLNKDANSTVSTTVTVSDANIFKRLKLFDWYVVIVKTTFFANNKM